MKNIVKFIFLLMFPCVSFAGQFNFGLNLPVVTQKIKFSYYDEVQLVQSDSSTKYEAFPLGAFLGYGINLIGSFGVDTKINIINFKNTELESSNNYYFLELNGMYNFNEKFQVLAGLNYSKSSNALIQPGFSSKEQIKFDPGLGYQAGIKYNFNENFGLEFILIKLAPKQTENDFNVQYTNLEWSLDTQGAIFRLFHSLN
ncbi:MAG: outer membrane beta-barrel protein [Bdellovibrionales bacterium]|nr:outer membrane beta-barrel protein [Bdellovibrionales bacterium]